MSLLFAATLFVSAFLLFWVQPLAGKILLPLLGGTPAVWNTCLLFFQAVLLAGYAYVLVVTRRLRTTRAQVLLHGALLVGAALFMLFGVSDVLASGDVPTGGSPAGWLLKALLLTAGPPFFVVSATAPLLQKWFSHTRAASAGDPYFLYAASNAGSLSALLAFPLLLEPNWTLAGQRVSWAWGYAALAVLIAACAVAALRTRTTFETEQEGKSDADDEREASAEGERVEVTGSLREAGDGGDEEARRVTLKQRARWALLAFVPSSLVLGATTYITTDVASAPLLWVIPLTLYLLSFVLVFARRTLLSWRLMARLLPGAGIIITLIYLSGATEPAWFLILFHLVFLFIAAMVCHGQLAEERPPAAHLAEFYLFVSIGGALGGFFNAIVAPLLFDSVAEYPLVILLACYLRPAMRAGRFGLPRFGGTKKGIEVVEDEEDGGAADSSVTWRDVAYPAGVGILTAVLIAVAVEFELETVEKLALTLGLPLLVLNHFFAPRPLRFALGLGAVMLASLLMSEPSGWTLYAERNFFGTIRVTRDEEDSMRRLSHGSTLHGRQYTDARRACEPLSYYHRRGPLGSLFESFEARAARPSNVAVVGLGTGASAAYSKPGQRWTFYEIDPAIVRLAQDPKLFTYLSTCAAAPVETVVGDARLRLREAPAGHYGLIALDAFSSDAVPAHLLTREALELYLSKLAPGGLIAFHVSNRSLDLERVVGGLAQHAGLAARVFTDKEYEPSSGKEPSEWVVVARREQDLGALDGDVRWQPLDETRGGFVLWSDDFSDIVSVFKWL
ncbi:MAG TPA: fused MFS/spermidine synthase [Pyrinomonadaceae bacterium]|nr:fused MFS/spermidine synthase [Pyrinomonadaceae bacterium]